MKYIYILAIVLLSASAFTQTYNQLSEGDQNYIGYRILFTNKLTHPLTQPYDNEEIVSILQSDSTSRSKRIIGYLHREQTSVYVGALAGLKTGGSLENLKANSGGAIHAHFQGTNLSAFLGYSVDSEYLEDSIYFGSTGKLGTKVFGRISESYLKYRHEKFVIFMGRTPLNFGLPNTFSLILSDNPHAYDHLSMTYEVSRFKYSYLISRLEDKYGYDIRDETQLAEWKKRYFSFHRLDWNVSDKITVAFSESVLYGGSNQHAVPFYLNPMNIYFISKMVERKGFEEQEANIIMSFDILYRPANNLIAYVQFLIDDIDILKEAREIYPDRLGLLSRLIWMHPEQQSLISLDYTRISNWTYNSFYTLGNYTHYGKSLGFPYHGYEALLLRYHNYSPEKLSYGIVASLERQRMQDLESHFIAAKSDFPIGNEQVLLSLTANWEYSFSRDLLFEGQIKLKRFDEYKHEVGNQYTELRLDMSAKYRIARSYKTI